MSTADGTLVIIVCRAKHLPNRRKLDKQCPYVTMRIGPTAKKTPAHFRAGQTPEWTHEIRFDLTRERKPILKLDVLDETKNEPTPIGQVEIDCLLVFSDPANRDGGKFILDRWYDLTLNGRRAGMIYLEMTFYPSAPVVPPKNAPHPAPIYEAPPVHPARMTTPDAVPESPVQHQSRLHALFSPSRPEALELTTYAVEVGGGGAAAGRFSKLKLKFQLKQPIGTLFLDGRSKSPSPHRLSSDRQTFEHVEVPLRAQSRSPTNHYQLPLPPLPVKDAQIRYSDDEDEPAPNPPPHRVELGASGGSHASGHSMFPDTLRLLQLSASSRSPQRKAPPPMEEGFLRLSLGLEPRGRPHTTAIPFSADTIGLEEPDVFPTLVYMYDQPVKLLSHSGSYSDAHRLNPNEIDPKFYAPTPTEHLTRALRLQSGHGTRHDVQVDTRTDTTGYLGDGRWQHDPRFSPSVFDRMPAADEGENKPAVPPKVPKGLSEMEYYVLERDSYLKDINGRRA